MVSKENICYECRMSFGARSLMTLFFLLLLTEVTWSKSLPAVKPRIVLITAAHLDDVFSLRDSSTWFGRFTEKLEDMVKEAFKSKDFDLRFYHNTDAWALHRFLISPNNAAVFYVGHAGWGSSKLHRTNLIKRHIIVDANGRDISDVFRLIHPNLRFLGLVGCTSSKAIKTMKQNGFFTDPKLYVHSFNDLVHPIDGLKRSIKEAKIRLNRPEIKEGYRGTCQAQEGFKIAYKRKMDPKVKFKRSPPVIVKMKNTILGVLPPLAAGEVQKGIFWAPKPKRVSKRSIRGSTPIRFDLKIVVTTAQGLLTRYNHDLERDEVINDPFALGDFQFLSHNSKKSRSFWKLMELKRPTGPAGSSKAFGVDTHIYRYFEPQDSQDKYEQYYPYPCVAIKGRK